VKGAAFGIGHQAAVRALDPAWPWPSCPGLRYRRLNVHWRRRRSSRSSYQPSVPGGGGSAILSRAASRRWRNALAVRRRGDGGAQFCWFGVLADQSEAHVARFVFNRIWPLRCLDQLTVFERWLGRSDFFVAGVEALGGFCHRGVGVLRRRGRAGVGAARGVLVSRIWVGWEWRG